MHIWIFAGALLIPPLYEAAVLVAAHDSSLRADPIRAAAVVSPAGVQARLVRHETPPLVSERAEALLFSQEHRCREPSDLSAAICDDHLSPLLKAQIKSDLSHYASFASDPELLQSELLLGARNRADDLVWVSIRAGIPSITPVRKPWLASATSRNRAPAMLGVLQVYTQSFPAEEIPDIDFVYNLGDWPVVRDADPFPIFSMTRLRKNQTDDRAGLHLDDGRGHLDILFPSPMLCWMQSDHVQEPPAWEARDDTVVWRGSNTGFGTRHELVTRAQGIPRSDIYFSACCCEDHNATCPANLRSWVALNQQASHKYIVDVDGQTFSTRFSSLLSSQSLVLKQASPYTEWYYPVFEAGTHYIELDRDLSDLEEKVQWVREHDDVALAIAAAGRQQLEDYLSFDDALCYIHLLLNEYKDLAPQRSHQ